MCGIVGVFNHSGSSSFVNESVLRAMTKPLHHRGPDTSGLYVSPDRQVGLGFTRLSIIDLSPAGNQPMCNEDGTVWIVYNGEIYNHADIRPQLEKKGHRYRSKTDTETILHLYEEKGIDCVHDLSGMFAFAIWDERKETLFLARDRLGVKPLYFAECQGHVVFGSEIKSILPFPGVARELDLEALYHFTTFVAVPSPSTLFRGIKKLAPGTYLEISTPGVIRVREYWNALWTTHDPLNLRTSGEFEEAIRNLVLEAVKKRMMSDVPVGAFLSGGVDSTTVVARMAQLLNAPVHTFSVGFRGEEPGEFNELSYGRKVAQHYGAIHEDVIIDENDMLQCLPGLIHHLDEPVASPVCVPMWYISKRARAANCIVIHVGEGSDEIFFGYEQYLGFLDNRWDRLREAVPGPVKAALQKSVMPMLHLYAAMLGRESPRQETIRRTLTGEELFWGKSCAFSESAKRLLFTENFRQSLNGRSSYGCVRDIYDAAVRARPEAGIMEKMTFFELRLRLAEELLMRVDKMSMASSIEARVPFLDYELVELAMRIPPHLKVQAEPKEILRNAVRGIIPDFVLSRPKVGFGAPIEKWFRAAPVVKCVTSRILDSGLYAKGYYNPRYVSGLFEQHAEGRRNNSYKIWNLLIQALWHDHWIEGRSLE